MKNLKKEMEDTFNQIYRVANHIEMVIGDHDKALDIAMRLYEIHYGTKGLNKTEKSFPDSEMKKVLDDIELEHERNLAAKMEYK